MQSRSPRILILFLLLLVLMVAQPAAAQAKYYFWEQFNVEVQLLENGDLRVTEQQVLNFSGDTFSFGFREIPIGSHGRNDGITDISVREGDIQYEQSNSQSDYTFRVDRSGSSVTIYWYFPPTLGSRTYTLNYTVEGGLRTEPSGDQVYWNAMPANLGAQVHNGQVSITVPEGIEILATTASVGGREDEGITTSVTEDGRRAVFQLTQARYSGNDVEVGVRFPSGQLNAPTPDWQRQEQTRDVLGLILLVVGLLIAIGGPTVALLVWYLFGRDPEQGVIAPSYLAEPPDDTPPAVVGTLVDERAHIHDIMSTLIDLARRGYLTMAEKGKSDFTFARTDKSDDDLRPYEQKLLRAFFGRTKRRDLNSLRYKFSSKLPGLRRDLYAELERSGFVTRSPETTRNTFGCFGGLVLGLAGLIFFGAITFFEGEIGTALCPAFALALTAVVFFIVGQHMPAKTEKGAQARAQWLAFKAYLQDIEKYENLAEAGQIFEKYLPYAIVFGLERSWIRKFATVPGTPIPPWYFPTHVPGPVRRGRGTRGPLSVPAGEGPGGGMPTLEGMTGGMTRGLENMSSGLTRMLTSTQTVLQSTRSSSSGGGGSFGGGFSGGSSGGGGGGFG